MRLVPLQHGTIPEECAHDGPKIGDLTGVCKDRGGIFGWSECNFKFLNALVGGLYKLRIQFTHIA
jgi:hypothetical protein